MSDEDATIATGPQQVVRVGLMEFGERHDTRTNEMVSAWQAERRSRRHSRQVILVASSRGCACPRGFYEETASVEFQLLRVS